MAHFLGLEDAERRKEFPKFRPSKKRSSSLSKLSHNFPLSPFNQRFTYRRYIKRYVRFKSYVYRIIHTPIFKCERRGVRTVKMKGIFAVAVFEMAIAVIIAMILQIVTIILILIDTEILNFRVLAVFFLVASMLLFLGVIYVLCGGVASRFGKKS